MHNNVEAELKTVEAKSKARPSKLHRDKAMAGGERAETPAEKIKRKRRKAKPPEPPIIERTP